MLNHWVCCTLMALALSGAVANGNVIGEGLAETPSKHMLAPADVGNPVRSELMASTFVASATREATETNAPAEGSVGVAVGSDDASNGVESTLLTTQGAEASSGWMAVLIVALFFTSTTIVAIFLLSRAPVMDFDDPRRYEVDGRMPGKLERQSDSGRQRPGRRPQASTKPRKPTRAIMNLDFTPKRST
ncbi:hypothetical protein [Allorhodopirellula heiligendammensis]|uniref:Transmembrane protein n=1 Tax=Allorhodopirellula heiligendammensis TaxID=2714739 RepID=A0A5C6C4L5_9BACT|nr:hypothetical protein [Allorhodopirellula heiligendammensis]TWU19493.1 hypothetical protein Poly21_16660 [Allorhodopirellula heiligendammensis]